VLPRRNSAPAIVDGETTLSFAELAARAERAAHALAALGVGRGDRVAVWAPNGWPWVVAALGAHAAGATLVPVNTRWKGEEAADVLARSRARVLFAFDRFLDFDYFDSLRPFELPELRARVCLRDAAPPGTLGFTDFLARAGETALPAVDGDDVSDILFTSGTTGRPKGVITTHAQTLRVFATWCAVVGLRAGDRYLIVNPYFHCFGYKAGWLACLLTGAVQYPVARFEAADLLARIERDRITVLPGPPTLYQALLAHPDRARRDLSSLRLAVTGAAVVPVELVERMRQELGFREVLTAYGLTESCGVVTMCGATDGDQTVATTSGRALPGTEVKVHAPTGEVWVRGYHVMRGYLDDPEATRAAIDADGWLHTGDIGVLDARGTLRITDRLKDMFVVGGFNAYPAEIENLLAEHAQIAQAAVVGAPDARLGEVGVAFVVLRQNGAVAVEELTAWARARMANYKVPRRIELVDALPLNAAGKVDKVALRARAARLGL
jgi:acyl-CoA synthetase (AMP-forming)/AMP-acid ligase II